MLFLDDTDIILIHADISADLKSLSRISDNTLTTLKAYIDGAIEPQYQKYTIYTLFSMINTSFRNRDVGYTYDTLLPILRVCFDDINTRITPINVNFYSKLAAYLITNSTADSTSEIKMQHLLECVGEFESVDVVYFKLLCKKELLRRKLLLNTSANDIRALSAEVRALIALATEEDEIIAQHVRMG